MSKKLWLALIVVVAVVWIGLKPHFSTLIHKESADISALTDARSVARYVLQNQQLPAFYLTKERARRMGWDPAKGNLCEVLPGKAIGGDRFGNREKRLPQRSGRFWYEADVNYRCGHREADRLIYSSDGLVYLTTDHYRSFKPVQ